MHLTLTDHLTCPLCGPRAGLVLLADQLRERRVLEGRLGCPSCRAGYEIRGGYAEMRPHVTDGSGEAAGAVVGEAPDPSQPPPDADERATRLAALLDLSEGRGLVVLQGPAGVLADALAGLLPDIEVVTTAPHLAELPERPGVSRLGADGLPFYESSMRAVALTGALSDGLLEGAVRVVAPGGRVLLDPWPPREGDVNMDGAVAALDALGARVMARERSTVVARAGA